MDEKNLQLIQLLRVNAREPVASLARQLCLSRTAVSERITKLEQQGIITGYTVRLSPEYEGHLIRAQVMIEVETKKSAMVLEALKKRLSVQSLHSISGAYDFIAMIQADSTEDIDHVLDDIRSIDGIEKTLSSIILATNFDRWE